MEMNMKTAAETKPLPQTASLEELMKLGVRRAEMNIPGEFMKHYDEATNSIVIWRETTQGNYERYKVLPRDNY
jgi:hypothetical protein